MSKGPFEPQWLVWLRTVALIVTFFWAWLWVMNEDYESMYQPMEPIRMSIDIIVDR